MPAFDWIDHTDDLDESQLNIVKQLDSERRLLRGMREKLKPMYRYEYCGMADFLLQHGTWYLPAPLPKEFYRGTPKACFTNSALLALNENLQYIEGVAWKDGLPLYFHHGWNVLYGADSTTVIDVTWDTIGSAYLGVPFDCHEALELMLQGTTVLDGHGVRGDLYKTRFRRSRVG